MNSVRSGAASVVSALFLLGVSCLPTLAQSNTEKTKGAGHTKTGTPGAKTAGTKSAAGGSSSKVTGKPANGAKAPSTKTAGHKALSHDEKMKGMAGVQKASMAPSQHKAIGSSTSTQTPLHGGKVATHASTGTRTVHTGAASGKTVKSSAKPAPNGSTTGIQKTGANATTSSKSKPAK